MEHIGILHPGEMGISLAHSALQAGQRVFWCSGGRSEKTRQRATSQGLIELPDLAELCTSCSIIISICPPHAAEEVAYAVIHHGFRGLYLDANAISPQRVARMAEEMQAAGIQIVDGGVIGGPAWNLGETRLYLSGQEPERIAACFINGPLATKIIGRQPGAASALKMCYAAYSKGTTALLCGILAAAESFGLREELTGQWEQDEPGFTEKVERRAVRVTAKAWRFEGEMFEIAQTFESAGLPGGFHEAAAQIYTRLAGFKDAPEPPELEAVLAALLKKRGAP